MHHVLRAAQMQPQTAYRGHSESYTRVALVDATVGSIHMGVGRCALGAGGSIDTNLHSFEESFYVLEGAPVLVMDGRACRLAPGACGLIPTDELLRVVVALVIGDRAAQAQPVEWAAK